MSAATLFPFTPREAFAFVVLGLAAGICLPMAAPAAAPTTEAPSANARTCAALAVYSMGEDSDDWSLKAAVSAVVLNTYQRETHGALCMDGTAEAMRVGFSPDRWQMALDVVDAVQTGDYLLPDDCFQATRVLPPGSDDRTPTSCVIQGYAFVRGDL